MNPVTSLPFRLLAGLLALVLLAACGGGDDGADAPEGAGDTTADVTASVDPADYLDVPEGVALTDAGTVLKLNKSAVVGWQPRQEQVAAAQVTVRRIERTSFDDAFAGYRITDEMAAMAPYFVRAQVTNPTKVDLGKVTVPLHLKDDAGTLVEATTIQGKFKPCAGGQLPKKFAKGAKASICLVYLVHADRKVEGVAFQLPGGLEPIVWSGKVRKYKARNAKSDD